MLINWNALIRPAGGLPTELRHLRDFYLLKSNEFLMKFAGMHREAIAFSSICRRQVLSALGSLRI